MRDFQALWLTYYYRGETCSSKSNGLAHPLGVVGLTPLSICDRPDYLHRPQHSVHRRGYTESGHLLLLDLLSAAGTWATRRFGTWSDRWPASLIHMQHHPSHG